MVDALITTLLVLLIPYTVGGLRVALYQVRAARHNGRDWRAQVVLFLFGVNLSPQVLDYYIRPIQKPPRKNGGDR